MRTLCPPPYGLLLFPPRRRCRCGCSTFISDFACLVCDMKWEDHETVFETTQERLAGGRSVGEAFFPLADDTAVQGLVFPPGGAGRGREVASTSTRPSQR